MDEPYKIKCKKIKLTGLGNRFEKLKNDYEAVANQRDCTTNAQEINSLEQQLKTILENLEKVGVESDQLQGEIQKLEAGEPTASIPEALQALLPLLTPISFDTVVKAYQSCLPEGRPRPVPATPEALLRQLDEIPGAAGEVKPLWRFVSLLIQDPSLNSDQQQALRGWATAQGMPPITSLSAEVQPKPVEICLMVKVQPRFVNDLSLGYLLSAAIAHDPDPLKPEVELVTTAIALPDGADPKYAPGYSEDELQNALSKLIAICGSDHNIPLTDLIVHCFLPIELMSLPIEHWQIRIGRNQQQCSGQRCRAVIVRSYDRHFSPDYQSVAGDWKKYWTRLLETVCKRWLSSFRFPSSLIFCEPPQH